MRHTSTSSRELHIFQHCVRIKKTGRLICVAQDVTERRSDDQKETGSVTLRRRAVLFSAACGASALTVPTSRAASPTGSIPKPFCGVTGVPSWAFNTPWEERLVEFHGHKTWCRIIGKEDTGDGGLFGLFGKKTDSAAGQKLPLLILHGGPGLPSRYLETLELLAGQGRQVIFYDQIGCGKSFLASDDIAPPGQDYSMDLFLDELSKVRSALGVKRHHVLGHGWGGMLALTALSRATSEEKEAVASLSLASVPPSYQQLIHDRQQRACELPKELQDALLGSAPEEMKAQALNEYRRRFITSKPDAGCLNVASAGQSSVVLTALCGPDQFQIGGILKDWNAADLLPSIDLPPTLVLRGENEELFRTSVESLVQSLQPDVTIRRFEGAGSYAHIDAWEAYLETVNTFLSAHD